MLTSQVPPSMASKRFFTSYPCSGSLVKRPSSPYLSDTLLLKHTQYACRVCNGDRTIVKAGLRNELPRRGQSFDPLADRVGEEPAHCEGRSPAGHVLGGTRPLRLECIVDL